MKRISSAVGEVDNFKHPQLCNCGNRLQIKNECWICYNKRTGAEDAHTQMLLDELERIGYARKEGETKKEHSRRCREFCVPRLRKLLEASRQANGVGKV